MYEIKNKPVTFYFYYFILIGSNSVLLTYKKQDYMASNFSSARILETDLKVKIHMKLSRPSFCC